MIGLDTNVLVRFLMEDDPEQYRMAWRLMAGLSASRQGFICRDVVLELAWVLERSYRMDRARIADVLDDLIASPEVVVEAGEDVASALAAWREGGAGLGDRMIVAAALRAGASPVMTFDRKAAGIPGMELLE